MAGPIPADRVKQTSTTTGTGTISLTGAAPSGYQGFVAGVGTANTCHYAIVHQSADEWEVGIGTVTDAGTDTLSRTTILSGSNGTSAVDLSAGTKDVFLVAPAVYGIPLMIVTTTLALRRAHETVGGQTLGNARGNFAVDLQGVRNNAGKVAGGNYASIGGGANNQASSNRTTIAGGVGNTASANAATVGGGVNNVASQAYATVCGGYGCTASGNYACTAGGVGNTTSGARSFIGSGENNVVSGGNSVALAGKGNSVTAAYAAVVAGSFGKADKRGQHAQSAGVFAATGDAQAGAYVMRKSTANATPADLALDGSSAALTMANDTTWVFDILLVARRTDANDESAGYRFTGVIDRNANAAATALVGTVTKVVLAEDTAAWDADVTADTTNGGPKITVTGEASKTIQWVAFVRTVETTG